MSTSDKNDAPQTLPVTDLAPVPLLERVRTEGRVWSDLAAQYGVANPDPPWKVNVEGTCDALAAGQCALPALERRWEEDDLAESIYADVPFPERQLLALAHTMIKRGLIDETELTARMEIVNRRFSE